MATSLGGCGRALEMLGLRHQSKPELHVRTADVGTGVAAMAEGRAHLAAGRTGLAIEQFQRALAAGEEIGEAANGMGVAYARLGQFEQAHRFFAQALAVDPENEKYRANMGRLMRSALLAQRHETDFAAQVTTRTLVDANDLQVTASKPEVTASEQPTRKASARGERTGSMTRVSRGEVMIRSAEPGSDARRGTLPVVGSRGSKIDNFKPAVRIEFSDDGKRKDAAGADERQEEAPSRTAAAEVQDFNPLVRIDFPTVRKRH